MKKNSSRFQKWLLLMMLVFCSHLPGIAQSGNNSSAKKNAGNEITISIVDVDYDDANFIALKQNIKKNAKCQNIKQSYAQNTAKLSFLYSGEATGVWDELPAVAKLPFKITSVESNRLELILKKAVTTSAEPLKTNAVGTASKIDDDCKNCYFKLCGYDGIKTFQGVPYKQINKDDGTYYYNCDNGVVVVKQIIKNGYGATLNITNDTILISNGPIGTTWGVTESKSEGLGFKSEEAHRYTLAAKGMTLKVNGNTYKDVIVVNYSGRSYDNFFSGANSVSINYYYARGAGVIKEEKVDPNSDPLENTSGTKGTTNPIVKTISIKGRFDSSLVGTWKYEQGKSIVYWKFNADGTYDSYTGSMTPANRNKVKCYWGFDHGVFTTNCEGEEYQNQNLRRYDFEKKNDPRTGKPTIIVNGYVYFSVDNKAPW